MKPGWVFPYDEVNKNSSIIIYGAGQMGRSFVRQIASTNYCNLVQWIDKRAEEYQKEGLNVTGIEDIEKAKNIDKILIAINSITICANVMKQLEDIGIASERIWTPFLTEKEQGINELKRYFYDYNKNMIDDNIFRINIHKLNIAFLIPEPIQGSGGHRNIFRAVKYLAAKGHRLTVYYTQTEEEESKIKDNVSAWFYSMEDVDFVKFNGDFNYHDIGIATWWETAYVLNSRKNRFHKLFYFVQDYEAYFYPTSSDYFLAENSYNLGMFHICSGPWCKKMIQKKYNADAVYFQFPVDKKIYYIRKRNKFNKNIVFFAKPEMPHRCYEIGIRALEIFKELRPDVEIIMYGSKNLEKENIPFEATVKKIVPTLNELAEIYTNADMGIVFSPTNPSLVPYEMMSCGCPVVDLDINEAIYKYGNNHKNIFLLPIDPVVFAKRLSEIIEDEELLKEHADCAKKWVDTEFLSELEMGKFIEYTVLEEVSKIINC